MWILVLLSTAWGLECPKYECKIFDTAQCARKYYDILELNTSFCALGNSCSLSGMLSWADTAKIGDVFECEEIPYVEEFNRGQYEYSCGDKKDDRDFADGSIQKECNDDSDCLLKDGTTTECQCTFNGKSYCIPAWDGSAFEGYWDDCKKGLDYDTVYYWILIKEFNSYTIDTPDCAEWLFSEFEFINEHEGNERPSSGSTKLLIMNLFISIILII